MAPCVERDEVIALIKDNGGEFIEEWSPESIDLLPYEINFILKQEFSHAIYSYKFIHDSVALKYLQPLVLYELTRFQPLPLPEVSKKPYTESENRAMENYVKTHIGKPNSIQYWKRAQEELKLNHSLESLKAHWNFLRQKSAKKKAETDKKPVLKNNKQNFLNTVTPKPEVNNRLVGKDYGSDVKSKENVSEVSDINHTISLNLPDFKRKTEKTDQSIKKTKIIPAQASEISEIEALFKTLIEICSYKSQKPISPSYVAKVLIDFDGLVESTIKFFECNS
jgi:hypothetical protein